MCGGRKRLGPASCGSLETGRVEGRFLGGNSDWSFRGIGKTVRLMIMNFLRKCLRVFLVVVFWGGFGVFLATGWAGDPQGYRAFRNGLIGDRTRPTYHLVSPEGKASPMDPNCAIYWKGRYHLFYIFQSISSRWLLSRFEMDDSQRGRSGYFPPSKSLDPND